MNYNIFPLHEWAEHMDFLSLETVYRLIAENTNGFNDKAVFRRGSGPNSLFIDLDSCVSWLSEHGYYKDDDELILRL